MKLSMELYDLSERFGDLRAMELAKEAGFDAIDYSYYYKKEEQEVLGEGYLDYAKKLRAHLDAIGLECNQAHAPFSLTYEMEGEEAEQKICLMERSIQAAAILGAKAIVVHAVRVPRGVDMEEYNVNLFKRLLPLCEQCGIKMAVENLFNHDRKRNGIISRLGKPQELNYVLDRLDSPWAVACIDVGHAALTGNEPQEFIEDIKPQYIQALHIHDNDYLDDHHQIPYTGKFDWPAIMTALKKSGYQGDLTLEILSYTLKFPDALMPQLIGFAAKVGRQLIHLFEKGDE